MDYGLPQIAPWFSIGFMISTWFLQRFYSCPRDPLRISWIRRNGPPPQSVMVQKTPAYDARSPQISNKYQIHITLSLPWWMIFIIWWIYWILLTIIEYYWILILDDTGSDLLILICSLTFVLSFHFLQFLDLDCKKTCPNCPIMAWGDSLESSCLALRIKGLVCASPSVPAWHGKDPQHKIIPYPSDHRCRAARDAASGLVSQM